MSVAAVEAVGLAGVGTESAGGESGSFDTIDDNKRETEGRIMFAGSKEGRQSVAEASARDAVNEERMLAASDAEDVDGILDITVSSNGYVDKLRPKSEASSAEACSWEELEGNPLGLPDCRSACKHTFDTYPQSLGDICWTDIRAAARSIPVDNIAFRVQKSGPQCGRWGYSPTEPTHYIGFLVQSILVGSVRSFLPIW